MAIGKEILNLANQHDGEKYVFGANVPFDNPNYKGPWDCAEFVSWIVYQITKVKIGIRGKEAYTGYWENDVSKYCKKISISEAALTYGAIVFRSPGFKGISIGHIAISDGKGGTIEAKSTNDGVCKSVIKGRQWEYGLLINNVQYEMNNAFVFDYNNPPFNFYVSSPIMKHKIVEETKEKLNKLNLFHGEINENYESEIAIAVSNFQKIKGIVVDAVLGKETLTLLKVKEYTNLEKNLMWFKNTFGDKLINSIKNTPFDIDLLTAIAYQETGYIWSRMINKTDINNLLLCCTGDTLDSPNRSAFPKNKTELLVYPQGNEMFIIGRQALKNVGDWDSTYKNLFEKNQSKFCRGYGIFQYDLQFFKHNPKYFLNKDWANFDKCLNLAIQELKSAQSRISTLKNKTTLTEKEKIFVAIAYNKGTADVNGSLKQGHKNSSSGKYYGELINDYYNVSKSL
ncbi:MAG: peptidoglycan-binding protein [Limnohabitans sp.]|nr:peptidoglycan-binding protein [Limnohabitans sp.]